MATTVEIPFRSGDEVKKYVSGINKTIDIENFQSSFLLAADDIADFITADVWTLMINHYNSDNFEKEDPTDEQKDLDTLVYRIQLPLANFGLFRHFAFINLSIGNDGVTMPEKTAYKYLQDEAKSALINIAWSGMNKLYLYIIEKNFASFKDSDQYKELQQLPFSSYKEFNKYFQIDNSAYFYSRVRYIMLDIMDNDVASRLTYADASDDLKKRIKKAVAWKTIATACETFAYHELPASIRRDYDNEMSKKGKESTEKFIRERLSSMYHRKADTLFDNIDTWIAENDNDDIEDLTTAVNEPEQMADDSFFSII